MKKPRVGIFKFTSCDGCQLTILNREDEFLNIVELFDISYFREASDKPLRGQFDISIVEGSLSADWQKQDLIDLRERSRNVIAIGACATAGGLQALRNWGSLPDYKKYVYPSPQFIDVLSTSTPVADHIFVDFELWGCPINSSAFSEVLVSLLVGKKPGVPKYSLCMECKRQGIPCLLVSHAEPCLGPITQAGCNALCTSRGRPCYGCFGPREDAHIDSLLRHFEKAGLSRTDCMQLLDKMNTNAYRRTQVEQNR